MKRAIIVATLPSFVTAFEMNNIKILRDMGYQVHVAANYNDDFNNSVDKLEQEGVVINHIDIERSPLKLSNLMAVRQLAKIFNEYHFDLVHCHTPVGGVIARLAAKKSRKKGTKVIYTAHGFHFFKGAPLKNWMVFYPIEKFFSRWTDVLVTINQEDYRRAKRKFHAKKVVYIPGVGIDTKKFRACDVNRKEKLAELGVPEDGFVLLSVGELNRNKNQAIIIDAIRELHNLNIYYLIVGLGGLYVDYQEMIKEYGLEKQVKLLGYRTDVRELCHVTNCFIHISLREGLGIAPLEAMASGLPLIASNIHGIKDYAKTRVTGYCVNPYSIDEIKEAIEKMVNDVSFCEQCSQNNLDIVKKFDISNTEKIMKEIYHGIG